MLYSANMLCHCGSGKKYKRCCRTRDEGMRDLFEKLSSRQLQFTARVISQNGDASSMEVSHASITQEGRTTVLLDEKVTLATNSTRGDKPTASVASISIPADGVSAGAIRTVGNASVANVAIPSKISLSGGKKELKAKSKSGLLFVVAQIKVDRATQIECFDFLFGERGQSEHVDESGKKQRPHLVLYPNGNGAFIRLSGHDCEIESDMQYQAGARQVVPQQLRIKSTDLGQTIEVNFTAEKPNEIILSEIRFLDQET
jgi:SEC-C motif